MGWTRRIDPDLDHLSITEFLLIWDMVDGIQLSDVDDQFRWRWEGCGHYSASSSYAAFFGGREETLAAAEIWDSRAPSRCQVLEDIDHILLGCVVSRHVWAVVLGHWDRPSWVPNVQHTLAGWWTDLEVANRRERKNLNTAIALVCWSI
ncbi:hypothetical protein BRADI_1g09225v3 [Brachypodium distachyon]|uniref:Reverse transcriptase zinc-binding domain-containing protein n=1 Tax=Brachypodium distachyon TaxID=15368 RepID=A0A2K2DIR6_BRADI|nr:hypothetical protein BRADI_1g09225v3 [Brachypodium distachyon]